MSCMSSQFLSVCRLHSRNSHGVACLSSAVIQNIPSHNRTKTNVQHIRNEVPVRTIFNYTVKKGIDRDFLSKIQQPIDLRPETIARWVAKKKLEEERYQQRYQEERHKQLGPDLATAHFIVARKGRVKFEGQDKWFQLEDGRVTLPTMFAPQFRLEAVDASSTLLLYEGLDNFVNLESLKYFDISNCLMIDDWCISKLESLKDTLLYLDISGCPLVSEMGLSTLHHLENLRRLKMENLTNVNNMALMTVLVEEMLPNCYVEGVHFNDADMLTKSVENGFSDNSNIDNGNIDDKHAHIS